MTARDPKPRISEVIKLCYSEGKYNEAIKTGRNGQTLVGRGEMSGGIPLEIYASNILGYGGSFSVYMWEEMPDGSREICRIISGRNLEVMAKPSGVYLEKLDEELVAPPEESVQTPAFEEDDSPVLRHNMPELQAVPSQPKTGNNPADNE
jgi:hypothetical protein